MSNGSYKKAGGIIHRTLKNRLIFHLLPSPWRCGSPVETFARQCKSPTEPVGETGGNTQYCRMRGLARLQYCL